MRGVRRSPAGLALSALGLLACAALAWGSLSVGRARALALADPARALAWAPRDARAQALLASTLLTAEMDPARVATVRRLAGDALQRDPTLVVAARTLGLLADLEGRPQALPLLRYAQSLSRRDLPTQTWFIEERAAAGDTAGALAHYDIALRTSTSAEAMLVPVLLAALPDPAILAGLAARLAARPDWREGFLLNAVRSAPSAEAVGALAIALAVRGTPLDPPALRELLVRLVTENAYARAAAVRASAGGGDPRRGPWPRDGRFDRAGDLPPFDWAMAEDGDLAAERRVEGGTAHLAFSATADTGGEAARQLLLLPPGPWRLTTRFAVERTDAIGRPAWQIRCANVSGAPLARVEMAGGAVTAQGDFTVPPDCPAQWLVLQLRASGGIDGTSGRIDSVAIARR